jgi:hypothetical protein
MTDTMQAAYAVTQTDVLRTYDAAACRLYKFTLDAPLDGFTMGLYGSFVDVYEGLEVFGNDPLSVDAVGLGIVTTGWAAPLVENSDQPPSAHPERVRVILYHAANVGGDHWGVLDMKGAPEQIESRNQAGSLLDAVHLALLAGSRVTV